MDGILAEIRKIPQVTRFLCASSLGITVPVLMGMISPYKLVYIRTLVFRRFEVWRLFTSFFLGGGGINYLFELMMLYRTTEQLESGPYARRSADLAYQLLYAAASIIAISTPLSSFVFTRPLLLCLTYLSSALSPPGAQSSLMGLVTFPVAYLPYVMIGLDLLMGGPSSAALSVAGAVVGHFWWLAVWGGGRGGGVLQAWARAPTWMRDLVGEGAYASGSSSSAGFRVVPPRQAQNTAGGSGSGIGGHRWGPGRTLGSS